MDRHVTVKITSRQMSGGQIHVSEDIYPGGKYYFSDGIHHILYEDTQGGLAENVSCCIAAGKNGIVLERSGAVRAKMNFFQGHDTSFVYAVSSGQLEFGIHTKNVSVRETGGSVNMSMDYSLSSCGERLSDHHVEIKVENSNDG